MNPTIDIHKLQAYLVLMSDDTNDTLVVDTSNLINTQANKRIQYPDSRDYEFSMKPVKHQGEDTYVIYNKFDMYVEFEKDEAKAKELLRNYNRYGLEIKRRIEDRVRIHKRSNPDFYVQTYEEANWVHKAIYKGFKVKANTKKFNPYDNWFGVSKNMPECILLRGDKKITLSMQSFLMPKEGFYKEELKPIFDSMSALYLCFKDNGEVVYETYTGILPEMEFIEQFITE
jgi:hypothetical protein